MGASLKDRARDIMAAFEDPQNKAVFTSIGGEDQIKLIKYLDKEIFLSNPKPFIGFSDNTHLHNFLWGLGIPSYYGGAIMTQFGMQGAMDDMTKRSIMSALFDGGSREILASDQFNDIGLDWKNVELLSELRQYEPNEGFFWSGDKNASGILWGGCVESLIYQSTAGLYLPDAEALDHTILFFETAEDIPEPWIVEYLLAGFGERGWFDKFQGVLVGRPKAWEFDKPHSVAEKALYRARQRDTILKTIRQYNNEIPVVQNIDFGHTDPQVIVPMGRRAHIDIERQSVVFEY